MGKAEGSVVVSGVYAHNGYINRRQLWIELNEHHITLTWLVLGDWKVVKSMDDHWGKAELALPIEDFHVDFAVVLKSSSSCSRISKEE